MRVGFKIVGVPEVRKALDQISEELAGQKLADAAVAGAMLIQNEWKDRAPFKTGTYKRSIHIEVLHKSRTRAEVAVGTDIDDPPYPYFLEYGTSRMPPHPSARPAFDAKKEEAATEIEETLLASVELIWR